MVELLVAEKQRLLIENGKIEEPDFEAAWDRCWAVMVTERAWPHATAHRRAWRSAMLACKSETRACFLGLPTAFQRVSGHLMRVADHSTFGGEDRVGGQMVA